jgi:hypothetical protein
MIMEGIPVVKPIPVDESQKEREAQKAKEPPGPDNYRG